MLGPTFDYTHRLLDSAASATVGTSLPAEAPQMRRRRTGRSLPRVTDILARDGLIEPSLRRTRTRRSATSPASRWSFPADRDLRLQCLARGDEGFLLALGYSTQRGYGRTHPFAGEIRFGEVEVEFVAEELGFAVPLGDIALTECQMVNQFKGSATEPPQFTRGYGLAFGQSERKTMSMALVDRALRAREFGEDATAPAQDEEFVLSHSDNVQATGFVEHLKLPHYVDFQSELGLLRTLRAGIRRSADNASLQRGRGMNDARTYNFAYLDEQTKRMIRRAILKAIAIPGYQVPFASREMPMPYGWGTGGVQVTAAILGPDDALKVIDQGADDTTNAISHPEVLRQHRRRRHHDQHAPTPRMIQTRHRDSRAPLQRGPDAGLSGADPGAVAVSRAARNRDAQDACARRIRR